MISYIVRVMFLTEVCHLHTAGRNVDVDYVVLSLNACKGNFIFCEFAEPTF